MIEGLVTGSLMFVTIIVFYGIWRLLEAIGFNNWYRNLIKKYKTLYQWIVFIFLVIPFFAIFVGGIVLLSGLS